MMCLTDERGMLAGVAGAARRVGVRRAGSVVGAGWVANSLPCAYYAQFMPTKCRIFVHLCRADPPVAGGAPRIISS
jgi:hypothetical protein